MYHSFHTKHEYKPFGFKPFMGFIKGVMKSTQGYSIQSLERDLPLQWKTTSAKKRKVLYGRSIMNSQRRKYFSLTFDTKLFRGSAVALGGTCLVRWGWWFVGNSVFYRLYQILNIHRVVKEEWILSTLFSLWQNH